MKFKSWTLNEPTNEEFYEYAREEGPEDWRMIDEDAYMSWSDVRKNFWSSFITNHDKITSIGLHDFGVNRDGLVYFYKLNSDTELMLNEDEDEIVHWIRASLRYLMDHYKDVDWYLQFVCMQNTGNPDRLDRILDNSTAGNGETTQDNLIRQMKILADFYHDRFPGAIKGIEVDFEKSSSRDREHKEAEKYRDFLIRVKNEVCLPKGLKLKVNLHAMTGDFNPNWYGWSDYRTIANGRDKNGNMICDEWQIMSYDFAHGDSAPGPSTPQWWLKEVLDHATDVFPAKDLWVGNAGYGRRWGLDDRQAGSAVTYHQLAMWQNGMYVHNHGDEDNDRWIWHDQSFLPFAGFNDEDSGYQQTFLHLYDKFNVHHAKSVDGKIDYLTYSDDDLLTSYFKNQQPNFIDVKGVANKPNISGNISGLYTSSGTTKTISGKNYNFPGAYRGNKALYLYDKEKDICEKSPDAQGNDGNINIDINIASGGSHKMIALVHFNTFQNDEIKGKVNGQSFTIGGSSLDDWFPFYVDQSAWIEVGTFDFATKNTIQVLPSSAYIWGFVICDGFEQNFLGGTVEFDASLSPYYKRNEHGEPVLTTLPDEMTFTGEVLRRPPRPAIIFEDNFVHLLQSEDDGTDIAQIPYYLKIQDTWNSGPNKEFYSIDNAFACTDSQGIHRAGYSKGKWTLQEDGTIRSSTSKSNQLMLHKKFSCNIDVRADLKIIGNTKAGIRLLANEEGNAQKGYLALIDYTRKKVVFAYEDSQGIHDIATEPMSSSLEDLQGSTVEFHATIYDGKAYVRVGSTEYLTGISLPNTISKGAYGLYVSGGTVYTSMFNISTVDRYEPLEKMRVQIDNQVHEYGEVPRTVDYDKYGYLDYSGLDINSTEIDSADWEEDYKNLPLAKDDSWNGKKSIRLQMTDAGIWVKRFYVGDNEGFSVAYNSDYIGFVETTKLLYDYNCKGVAMWTLGQEDPLIFSYLPSTEE